MSQGERRASTPLQRDAFDQGRVAGRLARVAQSKPSQYAIVGLDNYAKGYRAGFFNREGSQAKPVDTLIGEQVLRFKQKDRS